MSEELENIDLNPTQLNEVKKLLKYYLPDTEVWGYGSRVKFTAKTYSDLDIVAFASPEQKTAIYNLKEAFEESSLPFRVDLFVWNEVPEQFHANIRSERVMLQSKVDKNSNDIIWPVVRLGEYCSKIGSGATPRGGASVYLKESEICLIRSQNIYNDGFKTNGLVYITEKSADKLKNVIVEKNDILLNITGDSVARVCLVDERHLPARVNQHVAIIRPEPQEFDPRYLRYLLVSPVMQNLLLTIAAVGATQNALTKNMIETLEVSKPPLHVQVAIADKLESLDKKIELNRQTNQTLEQIAQAIFKSWFVDFEPVKAKIAAKHTLTPTLSQRERELVVELAAMCAISGKIEEQLKDLDKDALQQLKTTAALFPDTLLESELGEIPEGWEIKALKEIAENHSTTFDFSKVDEVIFVNTGDVLNGQFLHKKYSSKKSLPGQAKKTIKRDDILYSEIRPKNKRFAYVSENCEDYVVSTKFMIIRSFGIVHPRYLYQILRQSSTINEFNLIAESRSGTFPQITFDSIAYLPIVVPPEQLQNSFMNFFSPIIKKIDLVIIEEKNLALVRDSLLPKLLSGEITLNSTSIKDKPANSAMEPSNA